ncbi:MAG: hypothetical protein ACPF99_00760 [Flavobacteriaceae bacterium]
MKKYIVLTVLFVLPLVVYLFFASGVNHFAKLPVRSNTVVELSTYTEIHFKDRITILGFLGTDVATKKGNALNLNQKIYKRFKDFKDFQFVMLQPQGTEEACRNLAAELSGSTGTDLSGWNFAYVADVQLEHLYTSLNLPYELDQTMSTPYVFIIDKNGDLRGRDDNEFLGYDARSVADINNNMVDDVKVILAEYRLALKKYNADR